MSGIVQLQIWQFLLVYLLLILVMIVMKICHINQSKLLVWASMRMTVQLILAGLILTFIFKNPHPSFTIVYVAVMTIFTIYRVISKNKTLNINFKIIIGITITLSGLFTIIFFIFIIVGESIFNPQYVIPIAGMIMGNTMTGVTLGIKTFRESLYGQRSQIEALLNIGARPKDILLPFVRQAFETALLPTLNSMLGMGVVSLPGMMTGQILSGTLPLTAILYQIAIVISICAVVCLASFGSLYFGYKTLWNSRNQFIFF